MGKLWNRISAVLMAVILLCGGMVPAQAEGEDFDAFLEQEWKEMMEADYCAMHFSVKDYEKMGITMPEVSLGDIGYDYYARKKANEEKSLDHLHQFDFESLDERQKVDYQVYEDYLNNEIGINSYPNYIEMFNPYTGMHDNISTTLLEFVFYRRSDIDDYLVLVDDYDRYMDDMIAFTKGQAEQGYFMRDEALDVQLEQMRDFISKGEENPYIVIFNNQIDAYEGLSEEEKTEYKEKNRELVLNQVIPSNQKAVDFLETLRGTRKVTSIYEYPDGADYFNAQMMKKTSGSGTCQEKFDYLTKAVKDSISYLINITLTMEGNLDEKIDQFSSPEEYLEYLSNHLEDFPKGPDINYKASYLDPSVANPSVMAYYIFTPIDDVKDNIIRVNGTSSAGEDTNSMYYTLAHEGFPGHMYQFTWYFSQDFNPIRHDVDMLGYTEGWAQYVEKIMLNRSPLNPLAQESVAINTFAGYVVQAAADLAVNGLGYSEEDLLAWVGELGIGDASTAHTLYDAVIDMPGQILPYGYGMAKFWELRERTQSALGDDFNLEEFHLQLLTNGPRSFDIVEQDLEKYVESKGSKLPEKYTFFAHENSDSTNPVGTILQYGSSHLKELILIGVGGFIVVLALMFVICHAILRLIFGKH